MNLRYLDAIIFLSPAPRNHPCPGPKKWKTTCHWLASWDKKLQPRRIEDIISYHIISYHIPGESEDISLKSSKFRIHLRLFWEEWKELQRQGVLWTCNQRVTQWNTAEAAAAAIALHELLLGFQDILVKSWTTRNITSMYIYIYILCVLSDTWCSYPFLLLWVSISNLRAVSIFWALHVLVKSEGSGFFCSDPRSTRLRVIGFVDLQKFPKPTFWFQKKTRSIKVTNYWFSIIYT